MATRLKSIQYYAPVLASPTDNAFTNFTQFIAYIPEAASGTITFRSCVVEVQVRDSQTTTSNLTNRQTRISVGGAAATNSNLGGLYTYSGESVNPRWEADFTAHFTTNWGANGSRTIDIGMDFDSAAVTPIWRDATAKLTITYEYDDTQTTHVKTVYLPLNAPTGALATSKPAAIATIPALDTWLPEASKTIRQTTIVIEGNNHNTSTTDFTVSMELDSAGANTTGSHEAVNNTANWWRYTWQPSFTTNATHSFYIWGSAARMHHQQIYMVITYEFSPASSSTIMNSLILPFQATQPGDTSSTWRRVKTVLWIQEPTTITKQESAVFLYWDQTAAVATLNVRAYTGTAPSFTSYTDAAATLGGGNGCMRKSDADITLARGKNTLVVDLYDTDTTDLMWGVTGYWILNYTSGKSSQGVGAHNHTVFKSLMDNQTSQDEDWVTASTSLPIPETNYFLNNIGVCFREETNSTITSRAPTVLVERTSGECGFAWEKIFQAGIETDPETGIRTFMANVENGIFKRWNGDDFTDRLDIETARTWYFSDSDPIWGTLGLLFTYHSIEFTVGGDVTGSGGGTVNISVFKIDGTDEEKIKQTSRSGNGAYSVIVFDNTNTHFTEAMEDGTHIGRSADGTPTGSA